ncbi:MAG: TRAP transporter large permease subunit, partial [Hyphomicrobiaceae bacterium]|nr:TRAP transporter large permease subunit [Hyphomicrobiaceae bacterium]
GANITAVWLGVMIGLNIQTSFLTPPFGFALFYLRGVAPPVVKTIEIYKGVVPFILLQLLALVIVGATPPLVNYLPTRLSLLSDTAPPPLNPRLQYCIEQHVFSAYESRGPELRAAIAKAKQLDVSYLPASMQRSVKQGLRNADDVFTRYAAIKKAEAAMNARIPAYQPLHEKVRELQSQIRRLDTDVKELETRLSRLRGDGVAAEKAKLEQRIASIKREQAELKKQIPPNWAAERKSFATLQRQDMIARRLYRRAADNAYDPVAKTLAAIKATPQLVALESDVRGVGGLIDNSDIEATSTRIDALRKRVGAVVGAGDVRSALYNVRRELRRKTPDRKKAREEWQKAVAALEAQLSWRKRAEKDLLAGLATYEGAIRNTIGLRKQTKLPRTEALAVAACSSSHRDISLNF